MSDPPTGTVSLLFTDIEGSTRLLRQVRAQYAKVLAEHHRLLRDVFAEHGGTEVDTQGDAFFVVFRAARHAVAAAAAAQRALAAHTWPSGSDVRIRIGVHSGEPEIEAGRYVGLDVHRAARICAVAHGGQVVVSDATARLVAEELPAGFVLADLGEHRLKDFQQPQRLFQLLIPGLPAEFPPPHAASGRVSNLPAPATPLIGRARELGEVRELLRRESVRLVTVTGVGGTGKTRLALEVAASLLDEIADGVVVTSLDSVTDPALLPATIAQSLGIQESGPRTALLRLKDALRERRRLLLLDNFEQILSAAPLLAELVAEAPGLKLLVTSRAPLRISAEYEYPLSPLPASDAVDLFLDRARAVEPRLELTDADGRAVAEICSRLDGLPLAIELAAARIKLLPPRALLRRLERRLPLLTVGSRDRSARQQTLRATIDWSYRLLSDSGKTLFAQAGIFVGGFTLEAAEAVSARSEEPEVAVLDGLGELLDESLLRAQVATDDEPRFEMLDTIREFAVERLAAAGEREAVARAHAEHYLARAQCANEGLTGPHQLRRLRELEREHGNLRGALAWSLEHGDRATGVRLCASLWRFWRYRGHLDEGLRWLDAFRGETAGVELALRAEVLAGLGNLGCDRADYERARPCLEESLALTREVGDQRAVVDRLNDLGWLFHRREEYEHAARLFDEALRLAGRTAYTPGDARALHNLACVAYHTSEYERGRELFERSLAVFRSLGDVRQTAACLANLASVTLELEEFERTHDLLAEACALMQDLGSGAGLAWCLEKLAAVAAAQKEPLRAARLWGATAALREELGVPLPAGDRAIEDRHVAAAMAQLGRRAFEAAREEGEAMPVDDAVIYALAEASDARAPTSARADEITRAESS